MLLQVIEQNPPSTKRNGPQIRIVNAREKFLMWFSIMVQQSIIRNKKLLNANIISFKFWKEIRTQFGAFLKQTFRSRD